MGYYACMLSMCFDVTMDEVNGVHIRVFFKVFLRKIQRMRREIVNRMIEDRSMMFFSLLT